MSLILIPMFKQAMKTCSPVGRECIEKNSLNTFNCKVSCEGIYSDVQWFIDEKNVAADNLDSLPPISEYKTFKESIVQHFKFDPFKHTTMFRKYIFL